MSKRQKKPKTRFHRNWQARLLRKRCIIDYHYLTERIIVFDRDVGMPFAIFLGFELEQRIASTDAYRRCNGAPEPAKPIASQEPAEGDYFPWLNIRQPAESHGIRFTSGNFDLSPHKRQRMRSERKNLHPERP